MDGGEGLNRQYRLDTTINKLLEIWKSDHYTENTVNEDKHDKNDNKQQHQQDNNDNDTEIDELIVELSNQIYDIVIIEEKTKFHEELKMPSMMIIIPLIWPMFSNKHKSIKACGFRLLRIFCKNFNDIASIFYFYFKFYHHDRYFKYPYIKYRDLEENNNDIINAQEYELFNFYNVDSPYKVDTVVKSSINNISLDDNDGMRGVRTSSMIGDDNNNSDDIEVENLRNRSINNVSIQPLLRQLHIPTMNESKVSKWKPLITIICDILIQDIGIDVIECIKFLRKVIELKGLIFFDKFVLRKMIKLSNKINIESIEDGKFNENILIGISIIEFLCEIIIKDPQLSYDCGIIKYIIQILIDPPFLLNSYQLQNKSGDSAKIKNNKNNDMIKITKNLSISIMPTIIYLLNEPDRRKLLIDCNFLPLLLSSLIDPLVNNLNNKLRMEHLINILNIIMGTWTGLGLFLDDNYKNLRTLINGLYSEQVYVRTLVMSVIANGLRIKKLTMFGNKEEKNVLWDWEKIIFKYTNGIKIINENDDEDDDNNDNDNEKLNINEIKNKMRGRSCPEYEDDINKEFIKVFLKACLKCGLVGILEKLFDSYENDKRATRWISLLISEIMYLENIIFDKDDIIKFNIEKVNNDMNKLIEKETKRHFKLKNKLESLMKKKEEEKIKSIQYEDISLELIMKSTTLSNISKIIKLPINNENLSINDLLKGNDLIKFFEKLPNDIDIKPLIIQSNVLITKEYKEWNWDIIIILVKGILKNTKRFEEVHQTSKFLKRLISFYKPHKAGFVYISNNNNNNNSTNNDGDLISNINKVYIEVGISLMEVLVNNGDEGIEMLQDSQIVRYLVIALNEVSRRGGRIGNNNNNNNLSGMNFLNNSNNTINIIRNDDSISLNGGISNGNNGDIKLGLFSNERIKKSLTWSYIKFLSKIGSNKRGIKILSREGYYDSIFEIIKDKERNIELQKIIANEIEIDKDYKIRILIEKMSVYSNKEIKVIICKRLIKILNDNLINGKFNINLEMEEWIISTLIKQSYDNDEEISKIAIIGIKKFGKIEILIKQRIDVIDGKNGLIWKIIKDKAGKKYLYERYGRYIERIVEINVEGWIDNLNKLYEMENILSYGNARGVCVIRDFNNEEIFRNIKDILNCESGIDSIINGGGVKNLLSIIVKRLRRCIGIDDKVNDRNIKSPRIEISEEEYDYNNEFNEFGDNIDNDEGDRDNYYDNVITDDEGSSIEGDINDKDNDNDNNNNNNNNKDMNIDISTNRIITSIWAIGIICCSEYGLISVEDSLEELDIYEDIKNEIEGEEDGGDISTIVNIIRKISNRDNRDTTNTTNTEDWRIAGVSEVTISRIFGSF